MTATAPAETLRMTSWNLSGWLDVAPISDTNRLELEVVAAELRRLDPDVILLQHVGTSNSCARLAEALKPSAYNLTICSAFGDIPEKEGHPGLITNREELKSYYETGIRQTRADLEAAQKDLAESRTSLGGISRELMAQGITNWSEVTSDIAKEYGDISKQIEMFNDQERDLRYRGYKEAHPLVQAVRGQLRTFATRKAEFDHSFPTLKFIVEGTNAPNWSLAQQLDEYRSLDLRVAALQNNLSFEEEQLSQLMRERTEPSERADDGLFTGTGPKRVQVAILSKQKASFSRSYAWQSTNDSGFGGFSFAAIQTSKQNIGCFSVDFEGSLDVSASVRQLLGEIASMRKAQENQAETVLVGCTFGNPKKADGERQQEAIQLLLSAGFSDALSGLAGEQGKGKWRLASIFVESTGLVLNPQVTAGPVTCDIELDPVKVTAGRLARVEAQTKVPLRDPQNPVAMWTVGLLFAAVSFLSLGWVIGRSKSWRSRKAGSSLPVRAERVLTRPSSYTVIVAPTSMTGSAPDPAALPAVVPTVHVETPGSGSTQSGPWEQRALFAERRARQAEEAVRRGLLPHLSRWMREKLLRKLLVDRSQLLAAQEEATRKVMAVDARLNKLEAQIQRQTRIYVKRIEELTAELLAAKEENRELIRVKITQVKIEMEAARKKLLDQQGKPGS